MTYSRMTRAFFDRLVLQRPKTVIGLMLAVFAFLAVGIRGFRLDASSETLVVQTDEDLRYSRLIYYRYEQGDFLVLAYTSKGDLFSDDTLSDIARLRDKLASLERVTSVITILDVPLLESAHSVKELARELPTLCSPTIDPNQAKAELRGSPLYENLLLSPDAKTTALLINLAGDKKYDGLVQRRNALSEKEASDSLTSAERLELKQVMQQCDECRDTMRKQRHDDIAAVRAIMDKYRPGADLFLGGVTMIADDMITFIKNDLKVFGFGVFFLLVLSLLAIFKRIRWVVLPLLCCAASAISMIGLLGWLGWEVTVVSSNFVSLQLIMTLSLAIHLIVRYRELLANHPDESNHNLILETLVVKLRPCVYAVLTTIAGFASLVLCDILPVINFGWMMILGLVVSLIVTFLLFPSVLILLPKEPLPPPYRSRFSLLPVLASFTQRHGRFIVAAATVVVILSLIGISRLKVENSFIDYFGKDTEIYQGMKIIDQSLGGTTPLDVIVDFPRAESQLAAPNTKPQSDDVFDEFNEFEEAGKQEKYWFTADKMARIEAVHNYLDSLPETGKVLSLANVLEVAEKLNNGEPLDSFELALLYSETPPELKSVMIEPYVSVENNEARFWVRVRDSEKTLRRDELLKRIKTGLGNLPQLGRADVHLAGLLVLYNNMLQSLFNSQILTLGATVLILMAMFLVLFRSLKISLIAIAPNLLPIAFVLGFMGWLDIPLDMMTITIAAIGLGIAVDDTIHYIHRFKAEFQQDHRYIPTMHRCHRSIGHAMYYTSATIIIGFSILALSNFIPTVYFGLLTGLVMLIAIVAALTLLPQLIIMIKPFGKETPYSEAKEATVITQSSERSPGTNVGKTTFIVLIFMVIAAGCAQPARNSATDTALVSHDPNNAAYDEDFELLEEELAAKKVTVPDPLKPFNWVMYAFNDKLYFWVVKPVAQTYAAITPTPARIGIRNFFNNLTTPIRYVNCLLQGKGKAAGIESDRFLINTTVGILGFGDPAKDRYSKEPQYEDLGQTLAVHGVGEGFYLVLPLLGPSTARDALGWVGDLFLNPISYVEPTEAAVGVGATRFVNEGSLHIGDYESFKEAAIDPYIAMYEAYIQYRNKQIEE